MSAFHYSTDIVQAAVTLQNNLRFKSHSSEWCVLTGTCFHFFLSVLNYSWTNAPYINTTQAHVFQPVENVVKRLFATVYHSKQVLTDHLP